MYEETVDGWCMVTYGRGQLAVPIVLYKTSLGLKRGALMNVRSDCDAASGAN